MTMNSAVAGRRGRETVRLLLRAEGAVALLLSLAAYSALGYSWWLFALTLLAPDLAMLGYLRDPATGALVYNLAHTYALALPLALAGFYLGSALAAAPGLIWIAHIGLDRMLGYGLKYSTAFGHTHLGVKGGR